MGITKIKVVFDEFTPALIKRATQKSSLREISTN